MYLESWITRFFRPHNDFCANGCLLVLFIRGWFVLMTGFGCDLGCSCSDAGQYNHLSFAMRHVHAVTSICSDHADPRIGDAFTSTSRRKLSVLITFPHSLYVSTSPSWTKPRPIPLWLHALLSSRWRTMVIYPIRPLTCAWPRVIPMCRSTSSSGTSPHTLPLQLQENVPVSFEVPLCSTLIRHVGRLRSFHRWLLVLIMCHQLEKRI